MPVEWPYDTLIWPTGLIYLGWFNSDRADSQCSRRLILQHVWRARGTWQGLVTHALVNATDTSLAVVICYQRVCVQRPTSAINVTLLAVAAAHCAAVDHISRRRNHSSKPAARHNRGARRDRRTDRRTDGQTDGRTDRRTDRQTDGTDRRTGQTDGRRVVAAHCASSYQQHHRLWTSLNSARESNAVIRCRTADSGNNRHTAGPRTLLSSPMPSHSITFTLSDSLCITNVAWTVTATQQWSLRQKIRRNTYMRKANN